MSNTPFMALVPPSVAERVRATINDLVARGASLSEVREALRADGLTLSPGEAERIARLELAGCLPSYEIVGDATPRH